MFFTEDRLKQDATYLLFVLVFNNFISGSPSKADLSIPYLITQKLQVPFSSLTHWEKSANVEDSRFGNPYKLRFI